MKEALSSITRGSVGILATVGAASPWLDNLEQRLRITSIIAGIVVAVITAVSVSLSVVKQTRKLKREAKMEESEMG